MLPYLIFVKYNASYMRSNAERKSYTQLQIMSLIPRKLFKQKGKIKLTLPTSNNSRQPLHRTAKTVLYAIVFVIPWYTFPLISTSYDSRTSWIAAPTSQSLTSTPDS